MSDKWEVSNEKPRRPNLPTMADLVRRFFPEADDEDVSFYLWETTCFPFGSVLTVARQLKRNKKAIDNNESVCMRCGDRYENGGKTDFDSLCAPCNKYIL